MTLGEKIKKARKEKGITQAALAKDFFSRSMLSCIESGIAQPSMESLIYLSKELDLPVAYLLSDSDNLTFFIKSDKMPRIKELYKNKQYASCIRAIEMLGEPDDECAMLLSECYIKEGRRLLLNGKLASAETAFKKSVLYADKTIYDTDKYKNKTAMYLAICKNIQAPLLEFDQREYELNLEEQEDLEFYKYFTLDYDFPYKNETYALHLKAKTYLRNKNYAAALEILCDIVDNKRYKEYNAYVMFWIYFDMENAYRQLFDFENAYRYSSKRMSLIEGFKT